MVLVLLTPAARSLAIIARAIMARHFSYKLLQSLPFFIPLCLAMLLCPLSLSARKELSEPNRTNGFNGYDRNPYAYIYGSVVESSLIRDVKGRYGTNITFQPRYTSELFTESVLFCGNRTDIFDGAAGPIVITYQRTAHKMVRDVPCFDLVSVDRVERKEFSSRPAY